MALVSGRGPEVRLNSSEAICTTKVNDTEVLRHPGKWEKRPLPPSSAAPLWRVELPESIRSLGLVPLPMPPRVRTALSGFQIAYVDKNGFICLSNVSSRGSSPLVAPSGAVLGIDWLADGETLAAVIRNKIWHLQPGLVGVPREVGQFDETPGWATFSPSGERIAVLKPKPKSVPELVICDGHGKQITSLGTAYDPAWMGDDRLVYLKSSNSKWKLGIWDGENTEFRDAPFYSKGGAMPNVSRDLQEVAFAMEAPDGTQQIGALRLADKSVRQITRGAAGNTNSSFSPDSKYLAFSRGNGGALRPIIICDAQSGEEYSLVSWAKVIRPAWRVIPPPKLAVTPSGHSLRFDGTDDRVEVPSLAFDGSAVTVEMWIKCEKHKSSSPLAWLGEKHRMAFFPQNGISGFSVSSTQLTQSGR